MNNKICIVVQNYYEIAPRTRIETRTLTEAGYEVDVISLRSEASPGPKYELDGARIITIPIAKKRATKWRYIWEYLLFFIQATWLLNLRMLKQRYACIQICNLPDFLVFSALIPKLLGAKVIFDMVEVMPEFYISKYEVPEAHPFIQYLKWQEKLCTRFVDEIIVINDPIKDTLANRGVNPDKMTVVMNSADDRVFSSNAGEYETSHPNQKFVLMYHGTLTRIYGLDIAIRAFKQVVPQIQNAEFWIYGYGPELANLQALTQDLDLTEKVKFLGVIPHHEIPTWLKECSIGVLATRQDQFLDLSFSSKLPEYILMRKPVIMSRLKSIRHYFREESLAYFEPHNEDELAERIRELYCNPEIRQRYVENALMDYEKISWEIMRTRYLKIYQQA